MEASIEAYKLIKTAEGCKLTAYLCPAGKWTIGYGHTGPDVKPGMVIDLAKAESLLKSDVKIVEVQLNNLHLRLKQNQFDALVSFVFNLGIANFISSTLYRKISVNPCDFSIKDELMRWIYGGDGTHDRRDNDGDGQIDEPGERLDLDGLRKRRLAEINLYTK